MRCRRNLVSREFRSGRRAPAPAGSVRAHGVSLGLLFPAALHPAAVDRRAGHAGLYGGHHPARADHRAAGRAGPAVALEAAEHPADRGYRGVPLHAAAGADRLVLLRAAGAAGDPDSRGGRGGDDAVAVYRCVLCGDIPGWDRFNRTRAVGCGAGARAVALAYDAQGDPAAGDATDDPAIRQPVAYPVDEYLAGVAHCGSAPAVSGYVDYRGHLSAAGGLYR